VNDSNDVALLAAELAIRDLVSRYNRYLDDRRLDEVVALFANDGELHSMGQVARGHDELSTFFRVAEQEPLKRPVTAHHVANLVIEIDGEAATAESDFLVVRRSPESAFEIVVCGRYVDRLVQTSRGWRFAFRAASALGRASE
jgi:3-phenylpropionate/cinnamic acid dioxygenase small subunit